MFAFQRKDPHTFVVISGRGGRAERWPSVCVWGLFGALCGRVVWGPPRTSASLRQPRSSIWKMGIDNCTDQSHCEESINEVRALCKQGSPGPVVHFIFSEIVLVIQCFKKKKKKSLWKGASYIERGVVFWPPVSRRSFFCNLPPLFLPFTILQIRTSGQEGV